MPGAGIGQLPVAPKVPAPAGTPAGTPKPPPIGGNYGGDYGAYYQSLSPEEFAARTAAEARGAGPTYLQKWETAMPGSYNLGGDPNAANAYAAQAQATGQQAQNALNQAAAQSAGVGYTFGDQLAQTGQNYGEAIAGQSQAMGRELSQYGQQQGAGIQNLGQQYAGGIQDAGRAAQSFGGQQAIQLAGQGMQAGGYGLGQAGQIGQSAQQLGQMGQGVFGQAAGAANRNIIGQQQQALQGIEAQEGPSAAQAQLRSGLNQAQSSNLALARSGRGWGGSASSMAGAQQQNAAMGQQAANQSAMLRAQENAAYRSRAAQNIAQAGQLGLGQAQTNDAQQRALLAAGMQGVQAGGQMQAAAAGVGQQGYAQQLAAQQAAAAAGQAGIGQNLAAQQAGGQLGVQAQQAGAQIGLGGMQAGNQMALGGLEAGGNMSMAGLQGGGQMQLGGLAQSGNQSGQAALIGLDAQQQAMAAQQQQVANNMAYQNQMLGLHQGNQNYQMNAANNAAEASQASKDRIDKYAAAGIQFAGTAAALSDRDKKKGIEPANASMLVPPEPQYVAMPNGQIQQVENATNPDGSPYVTRVGKPINPATDTSGNGGPGGYEFGTGISGPNQLQGAQASNDAAAAASGAAKGAAADANLNAALGKGAGAANDFASAIGQSSGFQRNQAPMINFQPANIPQPMMPQLSLSDKNSKAHVRALETQNAAMSQQVDPVTAYRSRLAAAQSLLRQGLSEGEIRAIDPELSDSLREKPQDYFDPVQAYHSRRYAAENLIQQGLTPQQIAAEDPELADSLNESASQYFDPIAGGRMQPRAPFDPLQLSDRRSKSLYPVSDEDAKQMIEKAPGYSYEYKDPAAMGATDGQQFGIMAQDLEKTPAGRSVVKKQPDGTRMVDTSRLTMVNTAALNALAREVDELRARAGKGKAA